MTNEEISVLIVEDEPAHAEVILRSLKSEKTDYNCIIVSSLEEYFTEIENSIPDIVIADLNLPDGKAFDILSNNSDKTPFPVLVMTAFGNEDDAVRAIKAGAQDYIVKSENSFLDISHIIKRILREWDIIKKKKQAEEARDVHRTYLKALLDSTPDAIVTHDNTGTIIDINRRFTEMFGYLREESIGKKISTLMALNNKKKESISICSRAAKGEKIKIETVRAHKKGKEIDVLLNCAPIIKDEKQIGIYAIYHDIAEQKKAEHEKKKLEEQLIQAQKMEAIGTLAGGIAHDFNNILGIIMGYSDITMEQPEDPEFVKKNLQYIMKASDRAKNMVKQILAFSRKSEQTMQSIKIGEIIKETINFLRSSIPTTIEIRSNIEDDLESIMGNPTQINQVLMNLCTNAAQAIGNEGGVIEINLKEYIVESKNSTFPDLQQGKYQQLSISDTGCGMDKETIARVFEPYFTTKNDIDGTGLGLAVVYGIVKSHNGEIETDSKPGEGSTFNIYFPVKTIDHIKVDEKKAIPVSGGSERILFVDDELYLAKLGSTILEKLGYNVEYKTSSLEALELFKADPEKFDLLITDMTMPIMTGVKLSQEFQKIRPDFPTILCTGFSSSVNKDNYKSFGINAFLMKPLLKNEMANVVREIFD